MTNYKANENFSLKQYLQEIIQDKIKIFNSLVQWSDEDRNKFKILVDELETPSATFKESGDKLERVVEFIINKTFFLEVYRNIRTLTNEIDEVITVSNNGKQAFQELNLSRELIQIPTDIFIGECKNYSRPLGVTYVGKFYSLMKAANISFGIIFTTRGLSGSYKNFQDAHGLTAVLKIVEDLRNCNNQFYILTFTKKDYLKMIEGVNFFELVKAKKLEMQLHADYNLFLSKCEKHELAEEIQSILRNVEKH